MAYYPLLAPVAGSQIRIVGFREQKNAQPKLRPVSTPNGAARFNHLKKVQKQNAEVHKNLQDMRKPHEHPRPARH